MLKIINQNKYQFGFILPKNNEKLKHSLNQQK